MASSKPRITLYVDKEDMEYLGTWADSEYRTVPQLVMVFVKKALEQHKEQSKPASAPTPAPTETKSPAATKAKRGKESKEAS
jgi:hypothetical protein